MTYEEHIAVKNDQLDKVVEILGEHFAGYSVTVESESHDDSDTSITLHRYGGGFNRAYGLAVRAVRRFQSTDEQLNKNDPNEEE